MSNSRPPKKNPRNPPPWYGGYRSSGGTVGGTLPIMPGPDEWWVLKDGMWYEVLPEDLPLLEQEISQTIAALRETEVEDSPQFYLALADYYAGRGLVYQQRESLDRALEREGDNPSRTTLEQVATALTVIGEPDYAAHYYGYLADTAQDVATRAVFVEKQVLCLQKYLSVIREETS